MHTPEYRLTRLRGSAAVVGQPFQRRLRASSLNEPQLNSRSLTLSGRCTPHIVPRAVSLSVFRPFMNPTNMLILTEYLPFTKDERVRANEKLRVRQGEIPEFPIHGPSNMKQRSSRACRSTLSRKVV